MPIKIIAGEMAGVIRGLITEHEEAIRQLKVELSRHVDSGGINRISIRPVRSTTSQPSVKKRVIDAVGNTSDQYMIEELRKVVNADGGREIDKATFRSTHSRLVGKYCKLFKQHGGNQAAYYKKIVQEV